MEEKIEQLSAQVVAYAKRRWQLVVGAGLVVMCAGAGASWLYVRRAEQRNLAQAREMVARGEFRSAQLLLEQAVQVKPGSLAAQVALAEFLDGVGAAVALERWQVVVALAPTDEHRVKLAASALRLGQSMVAQEALDSISVGGRDGLEYHRLRAGLALAHGDRRGATPHLEAMVRLEPDNPRRQFALAAHQLWLDEDLDLTRQRLEGLARSGPLRVRATLELILDAPRRWPMTEDPEASLAVRLFDGGKAVQLRAAGRTGRPRLLAHLLAAPPPEPTDGAVLLAWLLRENRSRDARGWLELYPAKERSHPVLAAPVAELATRLQDWPLLEEALKRGVWGVIPVQLLRDAFAVHEQSAGGNRLQWQQLLEHPELSRGSLHVFWRLADLWGWKAEAERTLNLAIRRFPRERWPWEARREAAVRRGEVDEVVRLLADWEKSGAMPVEVRADRWLIPLLAGREEPALLAGADQFSAVAEAGADRFAVQAWLRRRAGRGNEGLALLDANRGEPGSRSPRWWLVYGTLLAESGRLSEARAAIDRVGGPLLPPEQAILTRVRKLAVDAAR